MRIINVWYWCFAPPFPAAYYLVSVSVFKNPLLAFHRCEQEKNANCLSIIFFLWISVSQCLYEELGWLLNLRGKQGDFLSWITWHRKVCFGWNKNVADSKDLLGSGAFSAFTVEVPFWKDHLWVTVLAAVENLYLQCSSSNSLMYSCPHSKHLQLLCSLCSSVGSRHWGKSCWFYVGRKMSSPNEEFRIRLA